MPQQVQQVRLGSRRGLTARSTAVGRGGRPFATLDGLDGQLAARSGPQAQPERQTTGSVLGTAVLNQSLSLLPPPALLCRHHGLQRRLAAARRLYSSGQPAVAADNDCTSNESDHCR